MIPSARLFRSRWAALLWAGGVLWTAADIAQSAPHEGARKASPTVARSHDAASDEANLDAPDINAADLETMANALDL